MFTKIANHLSEGSYPNGYSKTDQLALQKWSKYFKVDNLFLHYVSGGKTLTLEFTVGLTLFVENKNDV